MQKIVKDLAILGVGISLMAMFGCKSIKFEKIDREPKLDGTNVVAVAEKIVRGSYYTYGLKSDLEGLEFSYSLTNGVNLAINKAGSDMSEAHEKIIETSGAAAGKVAGVAVGAALGTSAVGSAAETIEGALE